MLVQGRAAAPKSSRPLPTTLHPNHNNNHHHHHQHQDYRFSPPNPLISPPGSLKTSTRSSSVFFLIATVAAVFFLRNTGDTAAFLYLQSKSQPIEKTLPFPHINWNHIPPIADTASTYANFRTERWIIVSVSDYPSDSLKKLVKIKGWQLLAIGNSKSPRDWALKGAIYLSLEQQASLGFRVVDFVPYDSYVRKSVGIYLLSSMGPRKSSTLMIVRSVWLEGCHWRMWVKLTTKFYTEIFGGKQFIQQGISNGLPDVDSVFYFTRKSGLEAFDIRFDEHAPKVALPQGIMVPVNSLNTMYHSSAFWGLMLPVSVSSMASDVLRGYWGQRLLWEIGRLIKFLVAWRSSKHRLFEKILELSYAMAEEGFWTEQDVKFTAAWLQDLIAVGYQQPRLMSLELDRPGASIGHGDRREFIPRKLPSVHLGVEETGTVSYEIGNLIRWRKNFGNVVLIMFCTGPVERTALEWRLLYGRIFKTVVILSQQKNEDLAVEEGNLEQLYKHLPKIFHRFASAEGFLFLKDDTVLNYWNLLQADKSKLWITDKIQWFLMIPYAYHDSNKSLWYRFRNPGLLSTKGNSDWHGKQAEMVKKVVGSMPVHFQVNYKDAMKSDQSVTICSSEIFYIPHHYVADFVDLVSLWMIWKSITKLPYLCSFFQWIRLRILTLLSTMLYKRKPPSTNSTIYSARAPAIHPWNVSSEQDFIKLVRIMAEGDPLLKELVLR
ncbi:hypothetical protein GH714_035982 [Hevea brasiliensis]|uniref:Uncharacterized protein n=1 Tax=Hevea brasiliensis TaxID=3981 RepID=A0A6A6KMU2_HEVBR|nr:hypothetical protein GH714_035982 [Hevea brasiliensis]